MKRQLPLKDIRTDGGTQQRDIDDSVVARQPIKQLNDMLKTVREGKDAGDLIFRYLKIENLTAEIANVKRIFRFAMPYAVCRYCGGDENNAECRACDGCGFVNEITHRSTPEELK